MGQELAIKNRGARRVSSVYTSTGRSSRTIKQSRLRASGNTWSVTGIYSRRPLEFFSCHSLALAVRLFMDYVSSRGRRISAEGRLKRWFPSYRQHLLPCQEAFFSLILLLRSSRAPMIRKPLFDNKLQVFLAGLWKRLAVPCIRGVLPPPHHYME